MKTVKPTLESLLEEIEDVYIRIDVSHKVRYLVASGVTASGAWAECPTALDRDASLLDIQRALEAMVYLIQLEDKQWSIEKPNHHLIRDYLLNKN